MLKITDADAVVVNAAFKPQPRPPVYAYGQILLQQLAFYHEDKNTPFTEAELTQYATWQYGIDNDYLFSTSPAALTVTGFTIDGNILSFLLRTDAAKVKTILGNNPTAAAVAELKGYLPGETLPSLQYQFAVQLRNAVIADGASTPPSEPQLYYTAAQVYSLIHAAPERQFSVDGATLWHDTQTDADRWYRERRLSGEWSVAFKIIIPPQLPTHSFTNADLVAGTLTVPHTYGDVIFPYVIINNDGKEEKLDSKNVTFSNNQIVFDLNIFGAITGTWRYAFGGAMGADSTVPGPAGVQGVSTRYAKGNISGAAAIDRANGDYQVCTTTAAVTGITISNLATETGMVLRINNGGGYTVTWGTTEIIAATDTGSYACAFYNDNGTVCYMGKSEIR